jgi:hypothetical protein
MGLYGRLLPSKAADKAIVGTHLTTVAAPSGITGTAAGLSRLNEIICLAFIGH